MWKYGQYCPIARATEILADRWTLLIVRELLDGVHHFNELDRSLPGVSRALLVERLRRLEQTGIVVRRTHTTRHVEYHLTRAGRDLQRIIDVLGGWGARWAFGDPHPHELDPVLLLWWMRRHVHRERLPDQRVVVEFEFRGGRSGTYWLIFNPGDISLVCNIRDSTSTSAFARISQPSTASGSGATDSPRRWREGRLDWSALPDSCAPSRAGLPGARC